jgi:hypothetical protein
MKRILLLTASFAAACSSSPEAVDTSAAALSANVADHGCRVFLFHAGIPSHAAVDGDFNGVQAVASRQDASGKSWWPFAADVGVGQYVDRAGITVGVLYSLDGRTWKTVETKAVPSMLYGTAVYHLEWGEGAVPFASGGSLLLCPPGSLHDCLAAQPGLVPVRVEAYVRMPDGTTYWDHNTANADQLLQNDMSSVRLDAGNAWQSPERDLLHCLQPGT